jgi:histone H1/5
MKKEKPQSQLKAARKKVKDDIQKKLAKVLLAITKELGHDSSKSSIDVVKESKKLAKKLTKDFKINIETANVPAPVIEAAAPAKIVAPKVKTVESTSPAKIVASKAKETKQVAPAKIAAPKVKAVAPAKEVKATKNGAARHVKK